MKRVLTILAILLLPLSVWAMTPISDSQLSDVTGQAGVSISFDVTLDMEFGNLGWGDSDGYAGFNVLNTIASGTANGGWIGIDSLEMSAVHIWPRTDYTMDTTGAGGWADLKFLTIDVASLNVAQTLAITSKDYGVFGTNVADVTMVVIGIPTLTLTMEEMSGNVVLGPRSTAQTIGGVIGGVYTEQIGNGDGLGNTTRGAIAIGGPVFDQLLGQFYVGGLNVATGGGSVYIFAHGMGATAGAFGTLYGSGVTVALNDVEVSYVLLDVAAWGDIDGVLTVSSVNTIYATQGLMGQGWVGLVDLAIDGITINGVLAIDVGTVLDATTAAALGDTTTNISQNPATAYNWPALVAAFNDAYLQTNGLGQNGTTFVSISFANFNINIGAMGGTVALGPSPASMTDIMGDIYLGGLNVTILDNALLGTHSFVHIFAH
ncbi:MAG: hypothetical protein RRA35_03270 [Desulfomonilia bacterium]|nr:hypothetical protein [Desulfomonilia bacterium]